MGVFLGQLPPAELARLKAELAETLIANFCYPRFYDYRTASLRVRPVDRSKRQEVWLYLSSVDFTAWNRVDLMSSDLQNQIERLFIHFVQRNRSFFGDQGRKRMADVRMLIATSAATVADGLRAHLTTHNAKKSPFGSPRPVPSWSTMNGTGRPEPGWEQIVQMTMLLQQQIQELRGEVKAQAAQPTPSASDGRAAGVPARRPGVHAAPSSPAQSVGANSHMRYPAPLPGAHNPAASATARSSAAVAAPVPSELPAASVAAPISKPVASKPAETVIPQSRISAPESETLPLSPIPAQQARGLSVASQPSTAGVATGLEEGGANVLVSNEDMAIFEELRHQLIVWLRVEAVRLGIDISGLSPAQLLEALRQQTGFDETRLQVVSTLLNLVTQVVKNGKASLIDYKQGLMFYLMHSRRP